MAKGSVLQICTLVSVRVRVLSAGKDCVLGIWRNDKATSAVSKIPSIVEQPGKCGSLPLDCSEALLTPPLMQDS